MIEIPALSSLDLSISPLAPDWKGRSAHIGPVGAVTPLVDALSGKTTCGTVSMMAGVLIWGCARLRHFTETDFCQELAEAAFAWQHDWRYVDVTAEPYFSPPDDPKEEAALFTLDEFVRDNIEGEKKWVSFYQPILPLFHMCNLVNFVMPKSQRALFETWLSSMITRMDAIAKAPELAVPDIDDFESKAAYRAYCAPRRGPPLPPMVLDLDTDLTGIDLQAEADKFLQSLDPSKNRFLRSPAQMLDMGFDGLPYGRPI